MRHGLLYTKPQVGDYKRGSRTRLGGLPIRPDGQWDDFVPQGEDQERGGFEPMDCTSAGTLNCVQTLERQEFGETNNYSERFLAEISGTTLNGNDPNYVAETLRKKGCVREADWPFTPDINTWGKFYQTPPPNIITLALEFIAKYDFGHQWVGVDQQSMTTALMYSPLAVDVFAWNAPDADGIYHRNGQPSEHWVMIYGYVANNYWKCFDSTTLTYKKLAWDFGFRMVKEFTLHKQVVNETAWDSFVRWFRQALNLNGAVFGGVARSPHWPQVRAEFLKTNPACAVCGKKDQLEVHHKKPYHLHPELELDPTNFIVLCNKSLHHLWFGHLGNFKSFNENVEIDAAHLLQEITNRP